MSLFPLPTNPQSVKALNLTVGPDTSRGVAIVSNPSAGPTGPASNFVVSEGNNPLNLAVRPFNGAPITSSLVLGPTGLTSSVPFIGPASTGQVIYASPVFLSGTTPPQAITNALDFATAGPAGTPLPAGLYVAVVYTDLAALPGQAEIRNGTACVPIYWNGAIAFGGLAPTGVIGAPAFENAIRVFTSTILGPNTIGPILTVDVTDLFLAYPAGNVPWQWTLFTVN